jgi:hypothetical protein
MIQLLAFAAIAALLWFWLDTMRARERAISIGRQACEKDGLQLLDETVFLKSVRLRRNERGHIAVWRNYGFEFSDNGNNRRAGNVTLLGGRLDGVQLEPYLIQSS